MHVFLDESGDLGFDFENKSPSKYFVITLLACSDKCAVNTFRSAVKKTLKNKVNHNKKKTDNELKASKALNKTKKYFYSYIPIAPQDAGFVTDKLPIKFLWQLPRMMNLCSFKVIFMLAY